MSAYYGRSTKISSAFDGTSITTNGRIFNCRFCVSEHVALSWPQAICNVLFAVMRDDAGGLRP